MNTTNNYDLFVFPTNWQRPIDSAHVRELADSMREVGNKLRLYPIVCKQLPNEKLLVLDGQHRVLAARDLGEQIHYQITEESELCSSDIVKISRRRRSWTLTDVLNGFSSRNRDSYRFVSDMMDEFSLDSSALGIFIGYSKEEKDRFLNGYMDLSDERRAELRTFFEYANSVYEIIGNDAKKAAFLRALSQMTSNPRFVPKRLLLRFETYYADRGYPFAGHEDAYEMIRSIYNYRTLETEKI